MRRVWYSARRDARGEGHVTRFERRRDRINGRPFTDSQGFRWGYEWAAHSLGSIALAIDLLADVQGYPPVRLSMDWSMFEAEVIASLPFSGWVLTREAVWDWYLAGVSITSLDRAAAEVLARGAH